MTMTKKQYNELQRLRHQEETFVFMMLVVKPEDVPVRTLYQEGYFGKVAHKRFIQILTKLHKNGLYQYKVLIDFGWAVTDNKELLTDNKG